MGRAGLQPAEEVDVADEVRADAFGSPGDAEPGDRHGHIVGTGRAAVNSKSETSGTGETNRTGAEPRYRRRRALLISAMPTPRTPRAMVSNSCSPPWKCIVVCAWFKDWPGARAAAGEEDSSS